MNDETTPKPLPEKVVRRHADMLCELFPEITRLVVDEGRPADGLLSRHLRAHRELGSRDRRFLAQAIFSYFRWYGWTVEKLKLPVAEACVLGAALDCTEISDSFNYLEGRCSLPHPVVPMGAKSLTEKAAMLTEWFSATPGFQTLDLSGLVPPEFVSLVDPDKAIPSIEHFQKRPPTWIRMRSDPAEIIEALAGQNVSSSAHGFLTTALSLPGGMNLAKLLPGHTGRFVVQDIASQCVGIVCAPERGEDWWDCCAGAGGKALHLMDLMQQEGKVLATDVRPPILKELKKRARKYGIRNIHTQTHNAIYHEPFKRAFDGILVDAPCSGWGTWSRNPDARWRTSKRDVVQYANRQVKILNNAAWCAKPGGSLVYAVCTLTRPETEEVVMHFLDGNPEFQLDPFPNPLNGEPTKGMLQIWPWDGPGDAMFMARFRREVH